MLFGCFYIFGILLGVIYIIYNIILLRCGVQNYNDRLSIKNDIKLSFLLLPIFPIFLVWLVMEFMFDYIFKICNKLLDIMVGDNKKEY